MDNNKKRLLAIAGGLGLIWFFQKTNAATKLSMRDSRIENIKLNGTALTFDVVTLIENLSAQSVTLQGLAGAVFLEGNSVGTLQSEANTQIARLALSPVRCTVYVPLLTTVVSTLPVFKKFLQGESINFSFKGTARVLGVGVPLFDSFSFKLPISLLKK